MKKQITAIFLAALMCIPMLVGCVNDPNGQTSDTPSQGSEASEVVSGETSDEEIIDNTVYPETEFFIKSAQNELYAYDVYEHGVKITDYYGKDEKLVMPDTIDDKPVVYINGFVFDGHKELKEVSLPSGVTELVNGLFYGCENIEKLTLCEGVTIIDNRFLGSEGPYKLKEMNIPSTVTYMNAGDLKGSPWHEALRDEFVVVGDGLLLKYNGAGGKITLPDTVKHIAEYCFRDTEITEVIIPPSVTEIDKYAFYGAEKLTKITLPETITKISSEAFYFSGLQQINIPDSVTEVEEGAFIGTPWFDSLTDEFVIVGDGVLIKYNGEAYKVNVLTGIKVITNGAFEENDVLKEVTLPETLSHIGKDAFAYCDDLETVSFPQSLTHIGDQAFFSCTSLTKIDLPSSVVSIGDHAFAFCDSLADVKLPDGLKALGADAFSNCDSLKTMVLPSKLKYIGETFAGTLYEPDSKLFYCTDGSLAEKYCMTNGYIYFTERDTETVKGATGSGYPVYDTSTLEQGESKENEDYRYSEYKEYVIIYEYIGDELIVNVPDKINGKPVISIETAFKNTAVREVTLPAGITELSYFAFSGCEYLRKLVLPETLKSIGSNVFEDCKRLTVINIPDGLDVKPGAFIGTPWRKLKTEEFVIIGDRLMYYNGKGGKVTVPEGVKVVYGLGGENITEVILPDSVTEIGEGAFSGASLTSIDIPDSVTKLGARAFYGNEKLTEIILPEKLTEIGNSAFDYCQSLTKADIPESVTYIGDDAFFYCTSLDNINIPEGVTYIGADAFRRTKWHDSIEDDFVIVNDGILIDYKGDYGNVVIPDGVKVISTGAFEVPDTQYPKPEFYEVLIPEGVTHIGDRAFYGCDKLTKVIFPSTLKEIGESAFQGCSALTSITLPEGLEVIREAAFEDCDGLLTANIPASVTRIEAFNFRWSWSITLHCKKGTYGEEYAKSHGYKYVTEETDV